MNAQFSKVTKVTHHTENFIIHVHIKPEACTGPLCTYIKMFVMFSTHYTCAYKTRNMYRTIVYIH